MKGRLYKYHVKNHPVNGIRITEYYIYNPNFSIMCVFNQNDNKGHVYKYDFTKSIQDMVQQENKIGWWLFTNRPNDAFNVYVLFDEGINFDDFKIFDQDVKSLGDLQMKIREILFTFYVEVFSNKVKAIYQKGIEL